MRKDQRWKFIVGAVVILAGVGYFAVAGFEQGKAYYITLAELQELGDDALEKPLKIAGTVVDGSIRNDAQGRLTFELVEEEEHLQIVYAGTDPVPDTFKDGSLAVVHGRCTESGVFEAHQIQAKCASKYEAKYEDMAKTAATP